MNEQITTVCQLPVQISLPLNFYTEMQWKLNYILEKQHKYISNDDFSRSATALWTGSSLF